MLDGLDREGVMTIDTNGWLLIWGGGLVLLALLIWWRTGRYDIKGAALESVWQVARGKRTADNPTPIETMASNIGAEATHFGKAKRTAFTVVGHFVAQVLSVVALFMLLIGLVLVAVGWFWG
jgi:hypothetical protein